MHSGEDWTEETGPEAEEALGYRFKDKKLLLCCFTHKSYSNVKGGENNERLEFLGDAVLQLAVTEELYLDISADEGRMTELRKQYVSKPALERAEGRAGLMRFLRYSGGEENVGGKTASNLFEAAVAGIYLDGGMEEAKKFLARYLKEIEPDNYKTRLQEYVQERAKVLPEYGKPEKSGEDFSVRVSALGMSSEGTGRSIREAETQAAKRLLDKLTERKRN